jgi:DNA-binding CsgD family transcriptional regulator
MRRRRMAGEGSLFRRADGLWVAQLSQGPRTDRKLLRRYAGTRAEAREKLEELRAAAGVADSRTTVGSYLRSWLDMTGSRTLKASTLETYEIAIRRQLVPHVGSVELRALAPEHVERMIRDLGTTPDERRPTEREVEILRVYIETGSYKGVAHRLALSESTVKNHMVTIRLKVGAMTTAEAVYLLHDRIGAKPKDG